MRPGIRFIRVPFLGGVSRVGYNTVDASSPKPRFDQEMRLQEVAME